MYLGCKGRLCVIDPNVITSTDQEPQDLRNVSCDCPRDELIKEIRVLRKFIEDCFDSLSIAGLEKVEEKYRARFSG